LIRHFGKMPLPWPIPIAGTFPWLPGDLDSCGVYEYLSPKHSLIYPYMSLPTINSEVVTACFDHFSNIITKKTVVIIDNAPTHTSKLFNKNVKKWEERGLFIKKLPPYSPELNLIEILWRFIKYKWLPFSAYNSLKDLADEIENILKNIGRKFRINFA